MRAPTDTGLNRTRQASRAIGTHWSDGDHVRNADTIKLKAPLSGGLTLSPTLICSR